MHSRGEKEQAGNVSPMPLTYHVILSTHNQAPHFTSSGKCNNLAYLLFEIAVLHKYSFFAFCIMPDHVHILCRPGDLLTSHFINLLRVRYEYLATKSGYQTPIWQPDYKEHPLSHEEIIDTALFIFESPARGGLVDSAMDYSHSFVYGGKDYRP
ncbi:MAG: transposase [Actinobacteria bacterium]|nr:transposase [Actinomycetota bacterium]